MPIAAASRTRSLALAALLALGACGGTAENNLAAIDNELLANGADPALTSALEDQILVDPNLVQQAHPNTVRPPETPVQAQYPAGSAQVQQASDTGGAGGGACAGPFQYGAAWANRLPAGFPAYPGGRITEAAGNDGGRCRVVTFTTADRYERVLEHYRLPRRTRRIHRRAPGARRRPCAGRHQREHRRRLLSGRDAAPERLRSRADRQQRPLTGGLPRAPLQARRCPTSFSSCSAALSARVCAMRSSLFAAHRLTAAFPWGTLDRQSRRRPADGTAARRRPRRAAADSDAIRLFLGVGVLGGFTTFSAFSPETAFMLLNGQVWTAGLYVVSSVLGSLLLLFVGLWLSGAGA